MARREKRFRQTFPGPNSADNQQMLQDIRSTLGQQTAASSSGTASGSPVERLERSDSKEREKERKREQTRRPSPPSELTSSGSPGTTPRLQPSRSTPTKQLDRESSSTRKKQLATIRRSLKPFAYSDPGFQTDREKVDKKMLEELISLGYNEVRAGSVPIPSMKYMYM